MVHGCKGASSHRTPRQASVHRRLVVDEFTARVRASAMPPFAAMQAKLSTTRGGIVLSRSALLKSSGKRLPTPKEHFRHTRALRSTEDGAKRGIRSAFFSAEMRHAVCFGGDCRAWSVTKAPAALLNVRRKFYRTFPTPLRRRVPQRHSVPSHRDRSFRGWTRISAALLRSYAG